MLHVFICYGGNEGELIGSNLRAYLRKNAIDAFLASPQDPDIPAGTEDFNKFIDGKLLSSNLMIPICNSGIHRSEPATREIQLAKQKKIPIVAFARKRCVLPKLIKKSWQPIRFDPDCPEETYPSLLLEIYRRVDYERELSEDLNLKRPAELLLPKQLLRFFGRP